MRQFIRIAAALSLVFCLSAQDPDVARIRKDVYALADPSMEGRATGTEGQRKALKYVSQQLREAGLAPLKASTRIDPYSLPYILVRTKLEASGSTFLMGKVSLKLGEDLLTTRIQAAGGDLLFIGYGIHAPDLKWDDYAGLEPKGRWVAMWETKARIHRQRQRRWLAPRGADETKLEWARKPVRRVAFHSGAA